MSTFSLSAQGLDFDFAASLEEQRERNYNWTDIEEMSADPYVDFDFEGRLLARLDAEHEEDEMELTSYALLLLGSDWDFDDELPETKDFYYAQISQQEERESIAAKEAAINLERELEAADGYLPSFSNNRERFNPFKLSWSDEIWKDKREILNEKARKLAKFKIDGKRDRKDKRSHRTGNRQEFAAMRDIFADGYGVLEELAREWNPPAIRLFDIELVGLTSEEASFYEAEAQHDADVYERELEMASWYWPEPDYSHLFAPIRSIEQYLWEREEYPTQYADLVFNEFNRIHHIDQFSYRFTSWDYYDDYAYMGDFYDDSYEDDQHNADSEDDHEPYYDDGPTLEEWLAIEEQADQRMYDDATEDFFPRFGGTVVKRKIRGYDQHAKFPEKRSKAHTSDRGWRSFAPKRHHGRDSIRLLPAETTHRYTATQYLSDNAGMNLH